MAINKVVNKSTKSHGAMRNVLEYVLREEKTKEGYLEISGPYQGETINYDEVYRTWLQEKQTWNKDSGRMYAHNIISFHKDEDTTPEQVLEIGRTFAERFFTDFQYVIGVHQDKDHLHCHIVTNSVSYIDGHKLHQTKRDLDRQKEFTNDLCRERGLSVAEKGHHFDGSRIEEGEIIAWNKDKYNLLINDSKKSYVAECAIAVMESVAQSASRNEFIAKMNELGWSVQWEDSRKHIVFQNENGDKVRDSNIEKTFAGMKVSKEALTYEFERQNEERFSGSASESVLRFMPGPALGPGSTQSGNDDIEDFLGELDSKTESARTDARDSGIERANRDAEQQRLAVERSARERAEREKREREMARRKRCISREDC